MNNLEKVKSEIVPDGDGEYLITREALVGVDYLDVYLHIVSALIEAHPEYSWAWTETPFTSPGGIRICWRRKIE